MVADIREKVSSARAPEQIYDASPTGESLSAQADDAAEREAER
jgi:hypothetical protein